MTDKHTLRRRYLGMRDLMSRDLRKNIDFDIINSLINFNIFNDYKTVLTYISVKNEVDTYQLIDYCLKNDKNVYVPVCEGNNMVFRSLYSTDRLSSGRFGIPIPDVEKSIKVTDFSDAVCIVPALSFDRNGNRLGYGGGFYDRFLSVNKICSIGLCRSGFLSDELPHFSTDIPVDYVITENEIINCRKL